MAEDSTKQYREFMALIGEPAVEFAMPEAMVDLLIRQAVVNSIAASLIIKQQTFAKRISRFRELRNGSEDVISWVQAMR